MIRHYTSWKDFLSSLVTYVHCRIVSEWVSGCYGRRAVEESDRGNSTSRVCFEGYGRVDSSRIVFIRTRRNDEWRLMHGHSH